MIKTSLKNLVKYLVFLFIPMGIFYFFLLAGAFLLAQALGENVAKTLSDLFALIGNTAEQSNASVNEFLAYAFSQLHRGDNLFETIRLVLSTGWIQTTLRGFMETLNASSAGFEGEFSAIVSAFKGEAVTDFCLFCAFCAVGLALANYATRFAIKNVGTGRDIKKFIVAHAVVPVVQTWIIICFLVLLSVIRFYSLLVLAALLFLAGVLSLVGSWLIYRDGTLKLRDVLTAKAILQHLAVLGIILLINLAIGVALYFINPVFALLLMIPIAIYSFNIADLNTDAYVRSLLPAAKTPARRVLKVTRG